MVVNPGDGNPHCAVEPSIAYGMMTKILKPHCKPSPAILAAFCATLATFLVGRSNVSFFLPLLFSGALSTGILSRQLACIRLLDNSSRNFGETAEGGH
jgi:hypothetical protein